MSGPGIEDQGEREGFLKKVFQYRDIILLVLLMISGFTGVYNVFVTKEQLDVFRCITGENIKLASTKVKIDLLREELMRSHGELQALLALENSGAAINVRKIEDLRFFTKNINEQISDIEKQRQKSIEVLGSKECGGE